MSDNILNASTWKALADNAIAFAEKYQLEKYNWERKRNLQGRKILCKFCVFCFASTAFAGTKAQHQPMLYPLSSRLYL